jgi:hypothetical protein
MKEAGKYPPKRLKATPYAERIEAAIEVELERKG